MYELLGLVYIIESPATVNIIKCVLFGMIIVEYYTRRSHRRGFIATHAQHQKPCRFVLYCIVFCILYFVFCILYFVFFIVF